MGVKLGIKKWSGAAFLGKPLQILTEEPKLVMERKIISLQHSVHQTVSDIKHSRDVHVTNSLRGRGFNWLSYVINQWMHCTLEI